MYVTQYRWAFDYFYGWRMVPVQVFVPVAQVVTVPTVNSPVYNTPFYGTAQGLRR